jgi:uncharacterized phage-associated protein
VATVRDVAAYILQQRGPMTAMKLQKLCFYAYGYHLAWEERPLFPERFEAWANGPISPALYACHRGRFELAADTIPGDRDALDAGERESIDLVLDGLGEYTAHQLSVMTHREGPWVAARARAHVGPMQRSAEELRIEEIAEYFDSLAADGEGRPATRGTLLG